VVTAVGAEVAPRCRRRAVHRSHISPGVGGPTRTICDISLAT